jgi:hypothetical protein
MNESFSNSEFLDCLIGTREWSISILDPAARPSDETPRRNASVLLRSLPQRVTERKRHAMDQGQLSRGGGRFSRTGHPLAWYHACDFLVYMACSPRMAGTTFATTQIPQNLTRTSKDDHHRAMATRSSCMERYSVAEAPISTLRQ